MSAPARDLILDVRVQPRASREGVDGWIGARLRVRVHAPPVGGSANRRVAELLARELGVPRSRVELVSGAAARDKRLRVRGATRRPEWLDGR